MKKNKNQKAIAILGAKKLTPLENQAIRGGLVPAESVHQEQHIDGTGGHHHVAHHSG